VVWVDQGVIVVHDGKFNKYCTYVVKILKLTILTVKLYTILQRY
jgi:hypothetical protein